MDSNQYLELIKFTVVVAGAVTMGIKGISKLAEVKKKQLEENSVGATKVAQITKEMFEFRREIDDMKKDDEETNRSLEKLKADYDKLIDRFIEFLKK